MTEQNPPPIGPAAEDEIEWVYKSVHHAIDESEFYNEDFKKVERARMTMNFLRALWEYDPYHLLILRKDGEKAGIMLSGPDNGVVFLYWSYIWPDKRASTIAIKANKFFIDYFGNGNWHKLVTFTRTTNEKANIILARYGWTEVAELKNHIFGEDYKIFEIQLEKTIPGYRPFHVLGRAGQFKQKLRKLIGRN